MQALPSRRALRDHLPGRSGLVGAEQQQHARVETQLRHRGAPGEDDRVARRGKVFGEHGVRAEHRDALGAKAATVCEVQRGVSQLRQFTHRIDAPLAQLWYGDAGGAQDRRAHAVLDQKVEIDRVVLHVDERFRFQRRADDERQLLTKRERIAGAGRLLCALVVAWPAQHGAPNCSRSESRARLFSGTEMASSTARCRRGSRRCSLG